MALVMLGAQAQTKLAQPQGAQPQPAAAQENLALQTIPDAPKPQATLPNLTSVAPGKGTTAATTADSTANRAPAPAPKPAPSAQPHPYQVTGDEADSGMTIHVGVNDVNVPFTVKDSKGKLVAGLTAREIQVYENGLLQHITRFTTDAFPLSVAIIVDQTLNQHDMDRVNAALGALQGAFTKYDEVAVYTYNNGPKLLTDFTGADSARLTQAIEESKGQGRDQLLAGDLSGPMSQTTVINNQNFDPNTASSRGHTGIQLNAPKEYHVLNDAILAAATALSRKPVERRRVIYVISDGKEYGSTAHFKDVVRYLQTNSIEVDGTLVGDSSLPVLGFLDRIHLPLTMSDNILPKYSTATGGVFDAEYMSGAIEKSFSRIAEEVRSRYTLDYITQEPLIDGKYRKLEVRVLRPGLTVLARQGYYPSAIQARPRPAAAQ
ncbi:MAG: VWA domain-containing protein [Acidobacteriaceae bacterium]|nr:VWA domain-containing protein [Acidobacteriaceae bacterium]